MLSAVFLGACQTIVPSYVPMPEPAKAQVASTDIVLPVKQSEIYVFVPDSNIAAAGGGGLLLALVDAGVNAARTSKAEDAVKPLRDALVGYDFDQIVADQVKAALPQPSWLNVTGVTVTKDLLPANLNNKLSQSKAAAVLFGYVDYQLNNDGNELMVTLRADLYPNTDALKAFRAMKPGKDLLAPQNAIYRNSVVFTRSVPAPSPKADRDAYIKVWSADKGAAMRAALNDAAVDVAKKLAADLGVKPAPAEAPVPAAAAPTPATAAPAPAAPAAAAPAVPAAPAK
jgi:hypothetical protein